MAVKSGANHDETWMRMTKLSKMETFPDNVLANPWDVIVCANNHPCLLVLRQVRAGDPITQYAFRALGKMKQPTQGQLISETLCPECGDCLFKTGSKVFKLQKRENQ